MELPKQSEEMLGARDRRERRLTLTRTRTPYYGVTDRVLRCIPLMSPCSSRTVVRHQSVQYGESLASRSSMFLGIFLHGMCTSLSPRDGSPQSPSLTTLPPVYVFSLRCSSLYAGTDFFHASSSRLQCHRPLTAA